MRVYQKTVPYTKAGELFRLVAFGDVHCGATNCDMEGFQRMLKRHGRKANTYLLDMGDACDCVIPKDVKRFRPRMVHPLFREHEDIIDRQIGWYVHQLETYVDPDKFIGLVSGNHHDAILEKHGTDPTDRIARALRCENLGYSFFLRLLFKKEGTGYQELVVYGHHGWGGGTRTEGANVTKFAKNASHIDADILLYGHTHDRFAKPLTRVRVIDNKVKQVPMIVANTGTFLKTLSNEETPSYAEKAGYPPRALGCVIIEIETPTTDKPYFGLRGLV